MPSTFDTFTSDPLQDGYLQKIVQIDDSGYGLLQKVFVMKDDVNTAADKCKEFVGDKFYTDTTIVMLTVKDLPEPDL